jgi:hypothetical protein
MKNRHPVGKMGWKTVTIVLFLATIKSQIKLKSMDETNERNRIDVEIQFE